MISDTLADAVSEIDGYLREEGPYSADDNLRRWILTVRDAMEALRCRLDIDPAGHEPWFREYAEAEPDA